MKTTLNLRLLKQTAIFTFLLAVAPMINVFTTNARAQSIVAPAVPDAEKISKEIDAAINNREPELYPAEFKFVPKPDDPQDALHSDTNPGRDYVLNLKKINKEVFCMAQNAFFEAGGESFRGKVAVSQVVMERTNSPGFPDTACGVVRHVVVTASKRRACQFSWWCTDRRDIPLYDKRGEIKPKVYQMWYDSVKAALLVYNNKAGEVVAGATHFYATKLVRPEWSRKMQKVEVIGGHTFLKPR
jgi:spore germination cell wall hydrolase CwlJ-like protein